MAVRSVGSRWSHGAPNPEPAEERCVERGIPAQRPGRPRGPGRPAQPTGGEPSGSSLSLGCEPVFSELGGGDPNRLGPRRAWVPWPRTQSSRPAWRPRGPGCDISPPENRRRKQLRQEARGLGWWAPSPSPPHPQPCPVWCSQPRLQGPRQPRAGPGGTCTGELGSCPLWALEAGKALCKPGHNPGGHLRGVSVENQPRR